MIRKKGAKFVLYTSSGKRKLGEHRSREGALRQEAAIKAREHAAKAKRR